MTSTTQRVRGWAAASQASGIAVRTLRRLHADGILPDHGKDERGVWLFDLGDLDRVCDQLGAAPADVAPLTDQVVPATSDPPESHDHPGQATTEGGTPLGNAPLFPWTACGEQSDRAPTPEPTTGFVAPPPWGVSTGPTWLDTIGNAIVRSRPPAAVEQLAHERDAARAEAEQLRVLLVHAQQQLADVQQYAQLQVAQVQHQVAQAMSSWAGERLAAIGLAIECELLYSAALVGLAPPKINAAVGRCRDAAVDAIRRLDYAQLADPIALDVARRAAHAMLAKLDARASRKRKHNSDSETSAN